MSILYALRRKADGDSTSVNHPVETNTSRGGIKFWLLSGKFSILVFAQLNLKFQDTKPPKKGENTGKKKKKTRCFRLFRRQAFAHSALARFLP